MSPPSTAARRKNRGLRPEVGGEGHRDMREGRPEVESFALPQASCWGGGRGAAGVEVPVRAGSEAVQGE